jgi:pimeloyl-ACP methyl ester carboxylesterase
MSNGSIEVAANLRDQSAGVDHGGSSIRHSMVEVNGAQLHVARTGEGRPLLLLHGWPEFWFTWKPVMVRLSDRFELIAPDLRGFGDSDKPVGDFGPEDQAMDMAELIKALAVGPVGVISHDVGGSVAQALARRHPEQIAGLFFFNFVYPGIGDRFNKPTHLNYVWHTFFNQSELAAPLLRSSPDAVGLFITYFIKLWAYHPEAFDEATLDAFIANFSKPGNIEGGSTYYRTVAAQRAREAEEGETPAPITLPTRVRWTECDKALEIKWTDRLGEFFTDLDYKPFPDAGHFPHHEQPEHAAHEIAEFFLQLDHLGWKPSPKAT